MIRQLMRSRRKKVIIDINTQNDFFLADGNSCIRNHRRILARIRRIMAWARRRNIPVISICQANPGNNGDDHCIDGTNGQKKLRYTLLNNHVSFAADGTTHLPQDVLRRHHQVILYKHCLDPFDEPRIERLLTEVNANEFIIIGATIEGAVAATALGLLHRGKKVVVVTDASGSLNKKQAEMAQRKIRAKGAKLIETRKIAGTSSLQRVGICRCQMCHTPAKETPVKVATTY